MDSTIAGPLEQIYGAETAATVTADLEQLLERWSSRIVAPDDYEGDGLGFSERDAVMIAYADSFTGDDRVPLANLLTFLSDDAEGVISGVHVLPFAPASSDDGFSVTDFRAVSPALGGWEHLEAIADEFKLMTDLVLNHCSVRSEWFTRFLAGEEPYSRFFITVDPKTDLSAVERPRPLPLLTEFQSAAGPVWVWTTFGPDQADLNYAEPAVLLEMLDVLLGYIAHGARIIRLDAIAYLWKDVGQTSIHHAKTHEVVKLLRAVTERFAPWVVIVTECNDSYGHNIGYLANRPDEARMVYSVPLPALTLDAFLRGSTDHLQEWATTLPTGDSTTTFFNALASHDGIALLPVRGVLSAEELQSMMDTVVTRGGNISYVRTPDGEIPGALNVSYLRAVVEPALPDAQRVAVFLAAQSIMLILAGVPGIYYHSLVGSENWEQGLQETGDGRAINRRRLDYEQLSSELATGGSLRALVFDGFKEMIRARAESEAFDPAAPAAVLPTPPSLLAVLRSSVDERAHVLCLVNVTGEPAAGVFTKEQLPGIAEPGFEDLLSGDYVYPTSEAGGGFSIELEAYEALWLRY